MNLPKRYSINEVPDNTDLSIQILTDNLEEKKLHIDDYIILASDFDKWLQKEVIESLESVKRTSNLSFWGLELENLLEDLKSKEKKQ